MKKLTLSGLILAIALLAMGLAINVSADAEPAESLTRAMLVTVLYRLEDEPQVSGNDGFSDAVLWATEQGVVNGYGNGLFGPDDDITQEQLNLIMSRYASEVATQNIPGFTGGVATQLKENFVGAHFADYDGYLALSHFKGHAMAGLGGAIKNISIGLGSRSYQLLSLD